jgi:hypothetical protein
MNRISELTAKIISIVFHPLLMSTVGLIFIFNSGTYLSYIPFEAKRVIFYLFLSGTFIIPICFIPIFIYFNIIESSQIDSPLHRIFPLIITGLLYFSTYYILRKFPIPFINLFLLSSSVCVFINACIVPWWKVSSHLIGAGGLTGLVLSMFFRLNAEISGLLIIAILISGLIGFARLRLNSHSQFQVYAGFFIGLITVCGMMLIF